MQRQIYRLRRIVKDSRERRFRSPAPFLSTFDSRLTNYINKKENPVEEEIKKKKRERERKGNRENKIVGICIVILKKDRFFSVNNGVIVLNGLEKGRWNIFFCLQERASLMLVARTIAGKACLHVQPAAVKAGDLNVAFMPGAYLSYAQVHAIPRPPPGY